MKAALRLFSVWVLLLAGCANVNDINMSAVESSCGQSCTKSYSECMGAFSFFPIQQQHQCTDVVRLCVQSCPAR